MGTQDGENRRETPSLSHQEDRGEVPEDVVPGSRLEAVGDPRKPCPYETKVEIRTPYGQFGGFVLEITVPFFVLGLSV